MAHQTVAEHIVHALEALGVGHVFGVPGGAIEPLYNAMGASRLKGKIFPVHSRHESSAASMAHGAYLASGQISVCCATTGPGATNLITGVASAYADHAPMIVITGQNSMSKLGRPALQDSSEHGVDTVSMFRQCTKYSAIVPNASAFYALFIKAIYEATRMPFGPVHLSMPTDVLNSKITVEWPEFQVEKPTFPVLSDELMKILTSEKMCIHIGRRALYLKEQLSLLWDHLNIPYITSAQGKFVVDSNAPQCAGVFGFCGHESAYALIREAQVVLSIGGNMEELSTDGWSSELCSKKLHCISADPDDLSRALPFSTVHYERPEDVVRYLLIHGKKQNWYKAVNPYAQSRSSVGENVVNHPGLMLELILEAVAQECPVFIDAGNSWCWYLHYVSSAKAFIESNFGAMGWAIGAAVGASVVSEKPSVVVTGDGSFLMHGNELSTAVEQKAPVLFVVMNDGGLGMVRHGQRLSGSADICNAFPKTSYVKMANAMGCDAFCLSSASDVLLFDWGMIKERTRPCLIEIMVDRDVPPPMAKRIASLLKTSLSEDQVS